MRIEIVTEANEELLRAFQRLIPQLTNNNPAPALNDLAALLRDPASTLLVARDDRGEIAGALTLVVYRVPTGIRSVVEDVIVESSARRQGIGEALLRYAIGLARSKGAANISLTSNERREAANRMYLRTGFIRRETNIFQIKL